MHLTMKAFVWRGLAAGAAGGAVAALFLRIVTETQIGFALKFEDAAGIGAPPGEAAEFTRGVQHVGGMVAAVLFGAVLGLVLGVTSAALRHRIAGTNEFQRVAKVAAAAFVAVTLLPALKYPPNPPTVGNPDTIGTRTASYLSLMLASMLIVLAAWWLWERLTRQGIDGAARVALGGGAFVLMVTAAFLIWPASPDRIEPPNNDAAAVLVISDDAPAAVLDQMLATGRETGDESYRDPKDPKEALDLDGVDQGTDLRGTPVAVSTSKLVSNAYASLLWSFRMKSFAGVALLWAVMAVVLGFLLDKQAAAQARPST